MNLDPKLVAKLQRAKKHHVITVIGFLSDLLAGSKFLEHANIGMVPYAPLDSPERKFLVEKEFVSVEESIADLLKNLQS